MLNKIEIKDLISAKVHLGHKKNKWHPLMKPYIYCLYRGLHIIDLKKTVPMIENALTFVDDIIKNKKHILFVGTEEPLFSKKIQALAASTGQYYITSRWLGGTFTNFATISKSIDKMKKIESIFANENKLVLYTKKERSIMQKQYDKLSKFLSGIKNMPGLPAAIFVVSANKNKTAVEEANRLSIPTIALTDTDTNISKIDYAIPANDDSYKSVVYILDLFESQILEAQKSFNQKTQIEHVDKDKKDKMEKKIVVSDINLIKKLRKKTGASIIACRKALSESNNDFEKAEAFIREQDKTAALKREFRESKEGIITIAYQNNTAIMVELNSETDFVAKNSQVTALAEKIAKNLITHSYEEVIESSRSEINKVVAMMGEKIVLNRFEKVTSHENEHIFYYVHNKITDNTGQLGVIIKLSSSALRESLEGLGKKLAVHIAASKPVYVSEGDIPEKTLSEQKSIIISSIEQDVPEGVRNKILEGKIAKIFAESVLTHQPLCFDESKTIASYIQEWEKELGHKITIQEFKLLQT